MTVKITEFSLISCMTRYTRTKEVKAPRERVYRYLTDVERLPELFPDTFTKMKVVGKEGDSRIIECEEKWAGRRFKYTIREKQFPPERIEQLVTDGNGKGTIQTMTLEEISDGTLVKWTIDAKGVTSSILSTLFRKRFEREIDRIFGTYTQVIEASR